MKYFGTEIVILELTDKTGKIAQDMVLNVAFNYQLENKDFTHDVQENINITIDKILVTFKNLYTDEEIQNVEIPIVFFTGAMIEYIEDCIVSNLKIEEPINLGDET